MTRFAPVDLSALPAPDVIEVLDFEVIFDALRDEVIAAAPELAEVLELESEPATKVLQIIAWSKLHDRARVNDAARAVMLPFALGADLEVLAALFGVTRAGGETDARLRERVRLALQAYSSAGPPGGYRYHALGADPRIRDVWVDSPAPGEVRVVVMSAEDNGTPDQPMLDAVTAAVMAEDVRVLCHQVTVEAATGLVYAVGADIEVGSGIAQAVAEAAAETSVLAYLARREGLGLRVTRSGLIAALHVEGVESVNLVDPETDIDPEADEYARCAGVVIGLTLDPPT